MDAALLIQFSDSSSLYHSFHYSVLVTKGANGVSILLSPYFQEMKSSLDEYLIL